MVEHEYILGEPLFYLFVVGTILLTVGYFQGRRKNREIFLDAFQALVDTVNPDDQTYTTIGGVVGYHANLLLKRKGPVARVDATITLLPRQSWLYLPISLLTMRFDRLFVTVHLKSDIPGEGHLIERSYSRFRGPKIANEVRLEKEPVRWGTLDFTLYYDNLNVRERFRDHLARHPDPGTIRHIALVPGDRKGFVFMIPKRGRVSATFRPVYELITSLATDVKKGKDP